MKADLVVRNAAQVVTPVDRGSPRRKGDLGRLRILRRASVAVRGGRIVAVGRNLRARRSIDAAGKVVTPGLVDPHTHLVFGGSREAEFELRVQGASYEKIYRAGGGILSTVRATRKASERELAVGSRARLRRMLRTGTTTAEIKSGYALTADGEGSMLRVIRRLADDQPITLVPTFLGAHALPLQYRRDPDRFVRLVIEKMLPRCASLARFCDVFCEPGYFTRAQSRAILEAGVRHGLRPKIHADEFRRSGGADLAARMGAASADHLGAINNRDVERLARSSTVAVLLPGTMYFLGKRKLPPARRLIDRGAAVALGTDCNPGSNMSSSLPMAMNQACVLLGMSPAEALTAATLNAAYAIGEESRAGSITPGKSADLVVWDADDYRTIAYEYGTSLVRQVIKAGRVVEATRV